MNFFKEQFRLFSSFFSEKFNNHIKPKNVLDKNAYSISFLIFILSAFIRISLIYTVDFSTAQRSDFGGYYTMTKDLVEKGIIPSQGHPNSTYGIFLYYAPIYKIFNGSLNGILTINSLLTSILFGLFTLALIKASGNILGIGFGIIMSFFPSNIIAHGLICSEIPAMFFAYIPILLFYIIKNKKPILLIFYGFLFAFSYMIRSANITFLFAFLLSILIFHKNWKNIVFCIIGFLIMVLPFSFFNYYKYGYFTPMPARTGGSLTYHYTFESNYAKMMNRMDFFDKVQEVQNKADPKMNPYEYDKLLLKVWKDYFLKNPYMIWEDFKYNWYPWRHADNGHYYAWMHAKPGKMLERWKKYSFNYFQTYYNIISFFGLIGIYAYLLICIINKRFHFIRSMLIIIIVSQTILYMLIFSIGRYHFCVVPIIAIFFTDFSIQVIRSLFFTPKNIFFKSLHSYYEESC